jgi:hypothetical protein
MLGGTQSALVATGPQGVLSRRARTKLEFLGQCTGFKNIVTKRNWCVCTLKNLSWTQRLGIAVPTRFRFISGEYSEFWLGPQPFCLSFFVFFLSSIHTCSQRVLTLSHECFFRILRSYYTWTLDAVVPLLSASWMEPDRKLHVDVSFRSLDHWSRVAFTNGGIYVGKFPPLHPMVDPGPGSETLHVKQAKYSKQRPSDAYSSLLFLYLGVQKFLCAVTSDKAPFVCKCEVDWFQLANVQVLKQYLKSNDSIIWSVKSSVLCLRSKYYPQHP